MGSLINIEFKRWTVVKQGELNGNKYRISKFSPNGVFKEYTASVYMFGEFLAFSGNFAKGHKDSAGHLTLESAEDTVKEYITRFMKSNANAIGMDY